MPNWLQILQRSIPKAIWKKIQYLAREDTDHITNHVCPQYFKSKEERTSLVTNQALHKSLTPATLVVFTSVTRGTFPGQSDEEQTVLI